MDPVRKQAFMLYLKNKYSPTLIKLVRLLHGFEKRHEYEPMRVYINERKRFFERVLRIINGDGRGYCGMHLIDLDRSLIYSLKSLKYAIIKESLKKKESISS